MLNRINAYWRLMRFNKPVGILLLWYPTAWALWLASQGRPSLLLCSLFLTGTVLMRAAGCVINDIADRHIDKHVQRTKLRPLTSGEITLPGAIICLGLLLLGALGVLLSLPSECFIWALVALVVTFIYPFCKRFLNAPQMVLGVAFSMSIPMVYVAESTAFDTAFFILYIINFAWIVAYDTMYAMTDKADDLLIGVKSTAIYFASYDLLIIGLLHAILHGLWIVLGLVIGAGAWFYGCWLLGTFILCYQQFLIKERIPAQCFKAFLTSTYYGAVMWLALVVS